ncbi:MAG TPA: hypothetical protein VFS19_05190 [Planctomycetota bacterium]|nr:hypothetical protein [Planctomycetota bacterium]
MNGIARPVIGMSCAMIGAVALCYAADALLFTLPRFAWIVEAFEVKARWPSRFIMSSGPWVLMALVAATTLSLILSVRHPGQKRSLITSIVTMMAAVAFTWLVNHAAWPESMRELLDFH